MPEFLLEALVDIEDYGADGAVPYDFPQSGDKVPLVQMRVGPAILGTVLVVGTEITRQKRTGLSVEPPFASLFSWNQVLRSELTNWQMEV